MTGERLKEATLLRVGSKRDVAEVRDAIGDELIAADIYRDAECYIEVGERCLCYEEYHDSSCHVEIARRAWHAAQDRRRSL